PTSAAPSPTVTGSVRLERPKGELIQILGRITGQTSALLAGVTPAGRFQPVLRGTVLRSGRPAPFIVRGPLLEGLRAEEIAALRSQEQPPVFPGGSGVRVGEIGRAHV